MSLKVARAGGGFLEAKFCGLGSLSAQMKDAGSAKGQRAL